MNMAFWIFWATAVLAFFAWRIPEYAGPAGLICIASILIMLGIEGLQR